MGAIWSMFDGCRSTSAEPQPEAKQKSQPNGTSATSASSSSSSKDRVGAGQFRLSDEYKTYDQLSAALKAVGFENCEVVLAIDFTGSNREQGAKSFGARDLHYPHELLLPKKGEACDAVECPPGGAGEGVPSGSVQRYRSIDEAKNWNPYQTVIAAMSTALETLSPARRIHVIGFGDTHTEDHSVFCLKKRSKGHLKTSVVSDLLTESEPCEGTAEVMDVYFKALPNIVKSGPTSFAPTIERVVDRVRRTGKYCFLFIIGDGAVTNKKENVNSIVGASAFPISISFIGVGDGPWDTMHEFDDELPERRFDNFQTVIYNKVMQECGHNPLRFAVHALMEVPAQLQAIRKLNYL